MIKVPNKLNIEIHSGNPCKTIKNCKDLEEIQYELDKIISQHSGMLTKVEDYELTVGSLIEAINWFIDPVKSEGRKDD